MSSLSIKGNKRFLCNALHYGWYTKATIEEKQTQYPKKLLQNWCMKQKDLDCILELSASIVNAENDYLIGKATPVKALYENEVLAVENKALETSPPDMDRWLALLVGNTLCNDFTNEENPKLFNSAYQVSPKRLFQLIKNWNHYGSDSAPAWGNMLFRGINMEVESIGLNTDYMNFTGIDFSYSSFSNFHTSYSNWRRTSLIHCSFSSVIYRFCQFQEAFFESIVKVELMELWECYVGRHFTLYKLPTFQSFFIPLFAKSFNITRDDIALEQASAFSRTLSGLINYDIKNGHHTVKELMGFFEYENDQVREYVVSEMIRLNEFEKNKQRESFDDETQKTILTAKEEEILILLAQGYQVKEIAEKLSIGSKTVESHKTSLMKKINARNVQDVVRFAVKNGYCPD